MREIPPSPALESDDPSVEERFAALASVVSFLSHELRTPLTTILAWTHMLRSRVQDPWTLKAIETIERGARNEARLVDDLLDVARIAEGRLRIEQTTVPLGETIQAAIGRLRPKAEAKGVRLSYEEVHPIALSMGDRTRVGEIVTRLVENGIAFTDAGGAVEVMVDLIGSDAQILVRDSGRGMSAETMGRLFGGPFRRDDGGGRGLGLGLYIARNLVALHGGEIHAASAGVGLGSLFTVVLPGATAAARKTGEFAPVNDGLLIGRGVASRTG